MALRVIRFNAEAVGRRAFAFVHLFFLPFSSFIFVWARAANTRFSARTNERIDSDLHANDAAIVSLHRVSQDNCPSLPAFVAQVFEQGRQLSVRSF